jgi:DNA repair exonuclease SbcCD ATPase subunit
MTLLSTAMVLPVGCSETPETRQTEALLQSTRRAQRILAKGQALLANPVYKDQQSGQLSPIPRQTWDEIVGETDRLARRLEELPESSDRYKQVQREYNQAIENMQRLTVLPPSSVHPDVLETLGKARSVIATALNANSEASESARSAAHATFGTVVASQGRAHIYTADDHRIEAAGLVTRAMAELMEMRNRQRRIEGVRTEIQALQQSVEAVRGQIEGIGDQEGIQPRLTSRQQRADQLQKELSDLEDRAETLTGQVNELTAKYSQTLIQAKAIPGQKGLEAMKAATDILDQANAKDNQLRETEYAIDSTRSDLALVRGRIEQARAEKAKAEQAIERFDGQIETLRSLEAELVALQTTETLGERIEQIASLTAQARQEEDEASNLLTQTAVGQFNRAKALTDESTGAMTAQVADIHMLLGMLTKQQVNHQRLLNQLRERVMAVWPEASDAPMPEESLAALADYVPNVETAEKRAGKDFAKAAELYRNAARLADREVAYLYHQMRATALVDQTRANIAAGRNDPRKDFQDALDASLRGNDEIPAVTEAAEDLRRLVEME